MNEERTQPHHNENESIKTLLEQKPTWKLRWGTTIVAAAMAILAIIIAFQQYPHSGGKYVWEVVIGK